ncbi:MAG: hypothetical protein QQN63_12655, partial [Nitrosopumilus sp.]
LLPDDPLCSCLIDAISKHDSSCGTAGVGKRFKNTTNHRCLGENSPFVPQCRKARYGFYAYYESIDQSVINSVDLYARLYAGLGSEEMTLKWASTTPERNPGYYNAIKSCFPQET